MTKTVLITYTNGETELRHVRSWTRDQYGVTWFMPESGKWEHSFCVKAVEEIRYNAENAKKVKR